MCLDSFSFFFIKYFHEVDINFNLNYLFFFEGEQVLQEFFLRISCGNSN